MRRMIPQNVWERIINKVDQFEHLFDVNPYMIHLEIAPTAWDENNQVKFTRTDYFSDETKLIQIGDGDDSTSEQREAISAADLTFAHLPVNNRLVVTANGTVPEITISLNCALWRHGHEKDLPIHPQN